MTTPAPWALREAQVVAKLQAAGLPDETRCLDYCTYAPCACIDVIARALEAERENCAKVICPQCEKGQWPAFKNANDAWVHSDKLNWLEVCKASAIRDQDQ